MKIKNIYVYYWHLTKLKNLDFEHGQKFDYSLKKRNEIIKKVLEQNYYIALKYSSNNLIVFIDDGKFKQR